MYNLLIEHNLDSLWKWCSYYAGGGAGCEAGGAGCEAGGAGGLGSPKQQFNPPSQVPELNGTAQSQAFSLHWVPGAPNPQILQREPN